MTKRERVIKAINHETPDRTPLDLGATGQTGISASALYKLRKALGLKEKPIKISEMFQMLGRVDEDVLERLGVDVIGLNSPYNMFGVKHTGYKPFTMSDGTPVLISEGNALEAMSDGSVLVYPQGDRSAAPSAIMPAGGYFFDNIDRVPGFDEGNLTPVEDFAHSFSVMDNETALYFEKEAARLCDETDYAVIGNFGGASLGDSAILPGPAEKSPAGIRRFDDWLMAHILFPDYIRAVLELQTDIALQNLKIFRQAVQDKIQIVWLSGTDFGTQNAEMISPGAFKNLYKPYYKKINDWVHNNTVWKTFFHCCGSIVNLLDDFVEMGVDILNPVQVSAKGMDATMLKDKYGASFTFWGGGVDTQNTLPFGTPGQVREEVLQRIKTFGRGGGYVFNTVHNILAGTPVENIMAMYEALTDSNI